MLSERTDFLMDIRYFDGVNRNFGFGCMRLSLQDGRVDYDAFRKMIDLFMAEGFNYFDTARIYLGGQSETALRDCLVQRYPRESFILTDKLSNLFQSEEEVRPLFESQLASCGVDYFDFYLMHSQNKSIFEKYRRCRAYEQAFELKAEGKIRHVGISFHDTAEVLDEILTAYPQIEVVQIQFNYADYNDSSVQGRQCYDVCRRHGKPILVMEPVKGGTLVNLPEEARRILDNLHGGSPASYAIRFAAGFEGIFMVLSGMSSLEQMQDNLSYMKEFQPLNAEEQEAIQKVCTIFRSMHTIPCTACRYCTDGCPRRILIPDLFSCMNAHSAHPKGDSGYYYSEVYTKRNGKASDCIGCGRCEASCPQHLPIRRLLCDVAHTFETEK